MVLKLSLTTVKNETRAKEEEESWIMIDQLDVTCSKIQSDNKEISPFYEIQKCVATFT